MKIIVILECWMLRGRIAIVCLSLVLMNIQPTVPILPSNSDGPTFPLEVSTDRYYYPPGKDVDITLTNVGDKYILFLNPPVNLFIVDSESGIVVDTKTCPKTMSSVRIYPDLYHWMEWDQRYLICDDDGDPVPPSGEEAPPGEYMISAGGDSAKYGDDELMPIWDSVPIEIGYGNKAPMANAGPDQTVYVGDTVQFDGSESSDSNAGWNRETVDSVGRVGSYTSMALDSSGYPHISYYDDTNENLKYTNWTGANWDIQTVDSKGDVGEYSSLALDDMGYPHISYYAGHHLKHANWTGSEWNIEKVDTNGYVGMYCSLALDSMGYPHISYYDNLASNLKYARWNGTAWNIETVDSDGAVGTYTSIAIDKNDQPHISYQDYDPDYDLKYVTRIADLWKIEVVDTEGGTGLFTSIALDRTGKPHISYYRGYGEVRYAKRTWSTWNTEVVHHDLAIAGGPSSSLALDEMGYPHIAYWDAYLFGGKGLRYSKWTSEGWSHEFIDLASGYHISLALDSNDVPHVSYMAPSKSDLKYATLGDRIIEYRWDFGDGSSHRTGLTPTHVYDNPGIYKVTLTVTDTFGASDTDNCVITVLEKENQQPVADVNGPYYVDEGSPVTLDGSGSTDPDNDTLQYRWDLDNDGVWDTNWSLNPVTANTWMDDGTYTVALEIKDADNETDKINGTVFVSDLAPTAGFGWSPSPQDEGSPIQFTDQSVSYPDALVSWSWEFDGGGSSTDRNPTYIYGDDGVYLVTSTVTDDDGSTDTTTHNITILNVAPTAHAGEDKAGFEVSTFSFYGNFTDPGILDTHTYEWDFDYEGITFDVDASGRSVSHTWIDDFNGTVALRVTDDDGGVGLDTANVLVKNVPPTVELTVLPMIVNASLRIAGEKWHDVSLELYEDGVLIAQGNITRYPGSPNDQMLHLTQISVNISRNYSVIVRYTPEDDPINGQPKGATPCWIILTFEDGEELRLHHNFNVQHPERDVWEVNLMAAIISHGLTFEAIAYDPGADALTFYWDFGDGTNATSSYPNSNNIFPVQITDTIAHVFLSSGTYIITVIVEDDDGGIGVATVDLVIP